MTFSRFPVLLAALIHLIPLSAIAEARSASSMHVTAIVAGSSVKGRAHTLGNTAVVLRAVSYPAYPKNASVHVLDYELEFGSAVVGSLTAANFSFAVTGLVSGPSVTDISVSPFDPLVWRIRIDPGNGGDGTVALVLENLDGISGAAIGSPITGDPYWIDVTGPEPPKNFASVREGMKYRLSWTAVQEPYLDGYAVFFGIDGGSIEHYYDFAAVDDPYGSFPVHPTGYLTGNMPAGHVYCFQLVAIDLAGNWSIPSAASCGADLKTQEILVVDTIYRTYGDSDFVPDAESSSGLETAFTVQQPEIASVNGKWIHLKHAGQTTITVSQNGNGAYAPAPEKTVILQVSKAKVHVVAEEVRKNIGAKDPVLTYKTVPDKLYFQDVFTGALERSPGEALGDYPILQGSLATSGDYVLGFEGNIFSIVKGPPSNDEAIGAMVLPKVQNYCSGAGFFDNLDATPSAELPAFGWKKRGRDVWYSFVAMGPALDMEVGGSEEGTENTLLDPLVALYSEDSGFLTEESIAATRYLNRRKIFKGDLQVGKRYYIRVSAEQALTGSFELCLNSYTPAARPSQDCSGAKVLCTKQTIKEGGVSGTGQNGFETEGSCLNGESNAIWYKWMAADNGTLTFEISPDQPEDLDWVLYDLGINGSCDQISPSGVIRCAAGSGVSCMPAYFVTGMNMVSPDLSESAGCVPMQDGFVRYVDMVKGHQYALMVNNYSSGNHGFQLSFGGTGEFAGPAAEILVEQGDACNQPDRVSLNARTDPSNQLEWDFGSGASPSVGTGKGPHTIWYASPGTKKVLLKVTSAMGCSTLVEQTILIPEPLGEPEILVDRSGVCEGESIGLSVEPVAGALYQWSGPNGFTAATASVSVILRTEADAGLYTLTLSRGSCERAAAVNLPAPSKIPVAVFEYGAGTDKMGGWGSIRFTGRSVDAVRYEWDFGDGTRAAEKDPVHVFSLPGTYSVRLRVFGQQGCASIDTVVEVSIGKQEGISLPSAFSPNGDGINDEFGVRSSERRRFVLSVFNRYGDRVFLTDRAGAGWNGRVKGSEVPVGVYFYQLEIFDGAASSSRHGGSLTLMR